MNRRVFINLIAFVGVFLLMCWWAVNNIITFDFIEKPYEISGEFAATAGVSANSEVAYLGVHYGTVDAVDSSGGKVLITMAIDRGKQIPAGSVARIFRKSAIGEPYIDFKPPDDFHQGGPSMQPGDVVPLSRTQVPLEFSELLRSASRVLEAVSPEQTHTLIHELAVALNGRGQTLRDLTVSSDALLQTFADKTELLDSLSANATRLTHTVTEHRGSISAAVSDLAALSESLRSVDPDTKVLLDRGSELLGQTADLVSDVKGNVDCVLSDLDDVINLTGNDHNLDNLRYTLDNLPTSLGYVYMTRDTQPGGLWVRVNLLVNPDNPPKQYIPPTQLPAVPEIPPCVSTLRSGGGPHDSGSAPGPVVAAARLPATGGHPAYALALLLLAGAGFSLATRRSMRP